MLESGLPWAASLLGFNSLSTMRPYFTTFSGLLAPPSHYHTLTSLMSPHTHLTGEKGKAGTWHRAKLGFQILRPNKNTIKQAKACQLEHLWDSCKDCGLHVISLQETQSDYFSNLYRNEGKKRHCSLDCMMQPCRPILCHACSQSIL